MDGLLLHQIILLLVSFLIPGIYSVSILTEGSFVVGNDLNITCTLHDEIDNETDVVLALERQDSNVIGSGSDIIIGRDDSIRTVLLSFDPLMYNDGGVYVCTARFNFTAENIYNELIIDKYTLIVQFPLPLIEISVIPEGPIFIGDNISLNCQIEVIDVSDSYLIIIQWKRNAVITKITEEFSTDNGSLSNRHEFIIDQVISEPLVIYSCDTIITPLSNDPYTAGVNYTNEFMISAIDPPTMNIAHYGVQNIGTTDYILNCSISSNINITFVWYKTGCQETEESVVINSTNDYTTMNSHYGILYFRILSVDSAGVYVCKAVMEGRVIAMTQTELLLTTPFNISIPHTTPYYIAISWSKPLLFVNQATNYTVTNNITNNTLTISPTSNTVLFNISGLRPYRYVLITIMATTVQREGVSVSLVHTTSQYVPGPVTNLNIMIINESSIIATWGPVPIEDSNGIIIKYQLTVFSNFSRGDQFTTTVHDRELLANDITNITYTVIGGLAPETRYLLHVTAINTQYIGIVSHHVFYTKEGTLPPPTDIIVDILNQTHISISWNYVTDMKGIVQSYIIMTNDMKRLLVESTINKVIVISRGGVYGVRIATVNGNNVSGQWSQWITNGGSAIIQIRGRPFKSCLEWNEHDINTIISLFKESLSNFTRLNCNCTFVIITFTNDFLSCDQTTPTDAIYRTNITGIAPYTTDTLVNVISQWIGNGATITFGINQIMLNPQCLVAIETINEPLCGEETVTDRPFDLNVIVPTILITIIMFIVLVISCVVCIMWRSIKVQTWRFDPCPTPVGHPWVYPQQQHYHFHSNNTIITNNSIEDDEEHDEEMPRNKEWVELTKEREGSTKEGEGSLTRGIEERDQSNLTVIYESDDESTKL